MPASAEHCLRRLGLVTAAAVVLAGWALGTADASAGGSSDAQRTYTYDVRTLGTVASSSASVASVASSTLNDPRGWSLGGSIAFVQVATGSDFTIWLSQASQVPTFSSACSSQWSCRVGRNVILNDDRWTFGSGSRPGPLAEYRQYVLNHEVGHWLGLGHWSCAAAGAPAPVMMQQSISAVPCVTTTWPLQAEVQSVASIHAVTVGSTTPTTTAPTTTTTTRPPATRSFAVYPLVENGDDQALVGDFDGDRYDDVFWYDPGPQSDRVRLTRGRRPGSDPWSASSLSVNGTYVPLVGDFNGDRFDDILWYGPGNAYDALWWGGNQPFEIGAITVGGTYLPVVGDFNGDGFDDVFWYGPGGAYDTVWWGGSGGFRSGSVTVSGVYDPFVGDFNGDGFDDIFWYGPGVASDGLWRGGRAGFTSAVTKVAGDYLPVVGDFDRNGFDDLFWYGPGPAYDALWWGQSGGWAIGSVAVSGVYTPFVLDAWGYPTVGGDDIFWQGSGTAHDSLWISK